MFPGTFPECFTTSWFVDCWGFIMLLQHPQHQLNLTKTCKEQLIRSKAGTPQ